LIVEDIGEAPYRIDRLLTQLLQAGGLAGVRALVFGEFAQCEPPTGTSWTLEDILTEFGDRSGIPTWLGGPIGHSARNHPIRWGTVGQLNADALSINEKTRAQLAGPGQ